MQGPATLFSIHSSADYHLDWFHILFLTSNGVINIQVQKWFNVLHWIFGYIDPGVAFLHHAVALVSFFEESAYSYSNDYSSLLCYQHYIMFFVLNFFFFGLFIFLPLIMCWAFGFVVLWFCLHFPDGQWCEAFFKIKIKLLNVSFYPRNIYSVFFIKPFLNLLLTCYSCTSYLFWFLHIIMCIKWNKIIYFSIQVYVLICPPMDYYFLAIEFFCVFVYAQYLHA